MWKNILPFSKLLSK